MVADIGQTIRVWITGTNPAGSDTAVTNHTFPVVDKPHFAPTASDSPLIVGTLEVGGVLTASIGTFTGDAPIATKQQWQRCNAVGGACKDIKGATKQIYHPTSSDVGSTLRLVVTATNLYGKATSISDVTEPVIPQLPHVKGEKIIGSNKADYLIGTLHDDTIKGNGGNDTINGDGGYDTIDGGSGNDVINVAGPGESHVNGGSGSDTIYAANGEKDTIDCGPGTGPRRHRPVRRRAQLRGRAGRQQLVVRRLVRRLVLGPVARAAALAGLVEVRERVAELRALGLELGERQHQPPLSFRGEPEVCDTGVPLRLRALDQPRLLGPADELGDRALGELEAFGELSDRGLLVPARGALDHEQEQVPLRRQARQARHALAPAQELAQRRPKLGHRDHVGDPRRAVGCRKIVHDTILVRRHGRASANATTFGISACSPPAGA